MLTPLYIGLVCNLCAVETVNPEVKPIAPASTILNNLVEQQANDVEQYSLSFNLQSLQDGNSGIGATENLSNLQFPLIESEETKLVELESATESFESLELSAEAVSQDSELLEDAIVLQSFKNTELPAVDYKQLSADTSVLDWSFVKESAKPDDSQLLTIQQDVDSLSSELLEDINLAQNTEDTESKVVEVESESEIVAAAESVDDKAIAFAENEAESEVELEVVNNDRLETSSISSTGNKKDSEYKPVDYQNLSVDTSVLDWSFVKENVAATENELFSTKDSTSVALAESEEKIESKAIEPEAVLESAANDIKAEENIQPVQIEPEVENSDRQPAEDVNLAKSLDTAETQVAAPETKETTKISAINAPVVPATVTESTADRFSVLPLGVNLGSRNALESSLVIGYEDGTQAVDLDNWLIPFNDLVSAFNLNVKPLEDGRLELRSPFLVKIVDPEEFTANPEIGMAISVGQIETLFDTTTEFSLQEYALILNPPWLNKTAPKDRRLNPNRRQISLEGLPEVKAPVFSFTTIGQRTNFSGSGDETDSSGELVGIGSTMGGSWLLRVDQNDLTKLDSWQLDDAQFLRQTPQLDYVLGIQPTFWNSQGSGDLTGFTTIKRWGFYSPYGGGSGDFSVNQRLRSDRNLRTISGEAEPGTLVQLVTTVGNTVLEEILVDSSGVYRFEDVATSVIGFKGVTSINNNYQVLLYEEGDLTREPESRSVSFSNLPGQLSKGTSAIVASAGMSRVQSQNSLLGEFEGLKGGASYRWGAREDLTVGLGAVYDESALGLTELFYQPSNKVQVRGSALVGGEEGMDYTANLRYEPSSKVSLNLDTDEISSRARVNWRANRDLSLSVNGDTNDSALGGSVGWSRRIKDLAVRTNFSFDTNSNFRWNLYSQLDDFTLRHRGNEISTNTELSLDLAGNAYDSKDSDLTLSYDANDESDRLLSLGWQYTPGQRTKDNRVPWRFGLGYGIGSQGQGIKASASTGIVPGLDLQARYDNISLSSNESRFSLNISPSLFLQPKLRPGSRNIENLRTQGGLYIQPFLDRNGNGKKDKKEEFYNEDLDFLLLLNEQPLDRYTLSKPDIRKDGLLANLFPGKYRLDIDPAGYPVGWKATETAFALDIAAGSYTSVTVPLIPSYILAGTAQDNEEVIAGARVEAISQETGLKYLTITNGVGTFYLENLPQGNYELLVNGSAVRSGNISLNEDSETFQEVNLQLN